MVNLIQASNEPVDVEHEIDRIERSVDFYRVPNKQCDVTDFKSMTNRKALKVMLSTMVMIASCYNKYWPKPLNEDMKEMYRKHVRGAKPGVEIP